jgi:hypothetical protein
LLKAQYETVMLTHEFAVGPVRITAAIAGAGAIVRSSTDAIISACQKLSRMPRNVR